MLQEKGGGSFIFRHLIKLAGRAKGIIFRPMIYEVVLALLILQNRKKDRLGNME